MITIAQLKESKIAEEPKDRLSRCLNLSEIWERGNPLIHRNRILTKLGKSTLYKAYGKNYTNKLKWYIKRRDNLTCQLCGEKNENIQYCIHHIDYDKTNSDPNNLILLCVWCHTKTNFLRNCWQLFFENRKTWISALNRGKKGHVCV